MSADRRGHSQLRSATVLMNCSRASSPVGMSTWIRSRAFLDPTIKHLMPDPYTLTDMEAASTRIADAVIRGERIAIFGDYDVDGATASALLCRYLRHCGLDPIVHIPDRIFEGYGPNIEAVRSFAERGAKLLITVDCGVSSLEPLAEARKCGLETVVIDHHQGDEKTPRGGRCG